MGHPALSIPEEMIAELPSILAKTGDRIEQLSIPIEHFRYPRNSQLPNIEFRCLSTDGAVVVAYLVQSATIAPDGLMIVLQPRSSGKRSTMTSLLKRIESVLREHGAVDLAEQIGITKTMVPKLPYILAAVATKVEQRPTTRHLEPLANKEKEVSDASFLCSAFGGAIVEVRVAQARNVAPDGLVVVLYPSMLPWWKRIGAIRLKKRIKRSLQQHGGIDLLNSQNDS
jgi:hypothetical protein